MFEDQGFATREEVFSSAEFQSVLEAIGRFSNGSQAGVRHLMSLSEVAGLTTDDRLLNLCQDITGKTLIPYKATLFNKTGKANWLVTWHQDIALPVEREFVADGWGPFTRKAGVTYGHAPTEALRKIVALRVHLDPSTPSNGPLRVIPGSHRKRVLDDTDFQRIVRSGEKIELTVGSGGVIAMSPLLIHASSKCASDEPRRVLHIEYAESLDMTSNIRLAIS